MCVMRNTVMLLTLLYGIVHSYILTTRLLCYKIMFQYLLSTYRLLTLCCNICSSSYCERTSAYESNSITVSLYALAFEMSFQKNMKTNNSICLFYQYLTLYSGGLANNVVLQVFPLKLCCPALMMSRLTSITTEQERFYNSIAQQCADIEKYCILV